MLTNKTILVTGGAGTFGYAFAHYTLTNGIRRLIIYSRDEAKHARMRAEFNDPRLDFRQGDVRDLPRLTQAMRAQSLDVLIHAGALKRVDGCEDEPHEATKTNVLGTMNVVDAAVAVGVPKVVFLSTDKAPEASTTYGKTKALAEAIIVRGNAYTGNVSTRFAATRYGNVQGSTGSVIPIWQGQRASGVLTVTDATATRFWMRPDEAVELVCWTMAHMVGGEVVIPKIPSASVGDVARAVGPGCKLHEIGLRATEKRHEILVGAEEVSRTYDCGEVYVIAPIDPTWPFHLPVGAVRVPADFRYASDGDPLPVQYVEAR
jgi:UDP-N-acetylglucosamine 4,6-dehydratase